MSQAGNEMPKAGDRFVQADLAKTLRDVAEHGAQSMYTGSWGQQFVSAVQKDGGKVTMDDMAAYQPTWVEPISTEFTGQSVFAPGGSNEGGQEVLEALNFAEEMKLDQQQPYWKDPAVFSRLSRILECVPARTQSQLLSGRPGYEGLREGDDPDAPARSAFGPGLAEPPP
jgi:gamma-glutamyltranspeptidase